MSNREEEYLHEKGVREVSPFFEAPDKKILAVDMFRGPDTGIFSDMDLSNPGQKLTTERDKLEEDIKRGKF